MVRSDEEYVRGVLETYLRQNDAHDACCELVHNDPPDVVCRVENERWAIEVTRVGQREVQNGSQKSRTEIDLPLMNFGRKLGRAVEPFRKLKYLLILNGLPSGMPWSTWKNQVRQAVEEFVRSGSFERRDFPGGSVSASNQGPDWLVAVGLRDDTSTPGGHMMPDISANIQVMLKHALDDKCKKLRAVSGFDRIGLVLLNTYPFGDDVAEVKSSLRNIIAEDEKYSTFDIVIYVTDGNLRMIYDKRGDPES